MKNLFRPTKKNAISYSKFDVKLVTDDKKFGRTVKPNEVGQTTNSFGSSHAHLCDVPKARKFTVWHV